jgi:hypothetical protein
MASPTAAPRLKKVIERVWLTRLKSQNPPAPVSPSAGAAAG